MQREQSRAEAGWLAGNIACPNLGTSQAVESQSLIKPACVPALLKRHSKAQRCPAERPNSFPQWWLSQRSFHQISEPPSHRQGPVPTGLAAQPPAATPDRRPRPLMVWHPYQAVQNLPDATAGLFPQQSCVFGWNDSRGGSRNGPGQFLRVRRCEAPTSWFELRRGGRGPRPAAMGTRPQGCASGASYRPSSTTEMSSHPRPAERAGVGVWLCSPLHLRSSYVLLTFNLRSNFPRADSSASVFLPPAAPPLDPRDCADAGSAVLRAFRPHQRSQILHFYDHPLSRQHNPFRQLCNPPAELSC